MIDLNKMPLGIKLIALWFILGIIKESPFILGMIVQERPNIEALVILGVSLMLLVLSIVIILKRFGWGWYFLLVSTAFHIIKNSSLLFLSAPCPSMNYVKIPISIGIIISITIFIYIFRRRTYFNT